MQQKPYDITLPKQRRTSVIFASPHSGRFYPPAFLEESVLDRQMIRSSEDAFVDRLFDSVPKFGAPLIVANYPRAYVDLNRGADELDPALIRGCRRAPANQRVASGLGVIPRVVAGGRAIYHGKMPLSQARERLDAVWHPYHDRIRTLMSESHLMFGEAILADCHSMPHEAVVSLCGKREEKPEIVLGDRFGTSADRRIVERIGAVFREAGFVVARNKPFAGAYIAQKYGRPAVHQHVVQIEIDRALYMDEARLEPKPDFAAFRDVISGIAREIARIGCAAGELPLAAE